MRSVLLTGFEPFGTTPVNPAEQVARHLDGGKVGGAKIVARIVPNTFFTCIAVVQAAIAELRPDVVVMMGEYGGRAMITVERIAQNLNDGARYGLRDNAGKLLQDVLTVPDGPVAYRTTLPIRAMVRAMRDAGITVGYLRHRRHLSLQSSDVWNLAPHRGRRPKYSCRLGASAPPPRSRGAGAESRCAQHVGRDRGRRPACGNRRHRRPRAGH